jgi:uncharacterized protein (TIGR02268 family)
MPVLLAAPLLLALLADTSTSAPPRSDEWDTSGARHLELTADNAGEPHPVRISPGQPTTLVFADAPLRPGGVEVAGGGLGVAVNAELGMVTLLPPDAPTLDGPRRVTVHFADGQVPGSVTFRLVPHATRAEHHVRVYREARSCESQGQEARQQRERAERCETELEQRTCPEGPRLGGFSGLIDAKLVGEGQGVLAREITDSITWRPGKPLRVSKAWSYRIEKENQVAVELAVDNAGPVPWVAQGLEAAELASPQGERLRVVRVWQSEPIQPGGRGTLVVEAKAPVKSQGTFILKLGEAGGARTLAVRDITFPLRGW